MFLGKQSQILSSINCSYLSNQSCPFWCRTLVFSYCQYCFEFHCVLSCISTLYHSHKVLLQSLYERAQKEKIATTHFWWFSANQ